MAVLAPFDVVDAFVMHFGAAVDLHSIFELAARFRDHRTQLPLALDFNFFQNIDFGSASVRSQMQRGGDCPSFKDFAQTLRGWTPRWTPNQKNVDTKMDTIRLTY